MFGLVAQSHCRPGTSAAQTISLTSDTHINVPGPKAQGDTLLVGMHVIVMAFPDANNNLVARAVLVIPGQPVRVHRVGPVTPYTAGASITQNRRRKWRQSWANSMNVINTCKLGNAS